jgi:NADPH:quinone reductase-like Zn-dependent oxidoreductase
MDLSYENYTPPTEENIRRLSREDKFVNAVKRIAETEGVEFVVATRGGKYASNVKQSFVLKEILAHVVEINGRAENVRMNN